MRLALVVSGKCKKKIDSKIIGFSKFINSNKCSMKTKFSYFITILCIVNTFVLQGQNSVNSSGNDLYGSGGIISYSVGQLCYTTISSNSGTVVQGVQQPYVISVVTETKSMSDIKCSVYPNPVSTYLQIEINNYSTNNLNYILYDYAGNLLKLGKIENSIIRFEINNYYKSGFLLKINENDNTIKTFKIIKK